MSMVWEDAPDKEQLNARREELAEIDKRIALVEFEIDQIDPKQEGYLQAACKAEMARIAHARMNEPVADLEKNWVIAGQYAGVEALMNREQVLNDQLQALMEDKAQSQQDLLAAENAVHNQQTTPE